MSTLAGKKQGFISDHFLANSYSPKLIKLLFSTSATYDPFVDFCFSIHKLIYFFFTSAKLHDNMTRQKSSRKDSTKRIGYFYSTSLDYNSKNELICQKLDS